MRIEHLTEKITDGVATLCMNRPEALNAFSPAMMAALQEAIPRLASDSDVRVIALTGAGRAFSAGGDVKGFAGASKSSGDDQQGNNELKATVEQRTAGLRESTRMVEILHSMDKPTVALIPGVAAGGGFSVALACDIRLACQSARFTTAFAKVAVSGDYGGSYFLTQLVGPAKAKELYFRSDILGSSEALSLGIVNQVFKDDDFEDRCQQFLSQLAAMPPIALNYMKKNMNLASRSDLASVLDQEAQFMTRCFDTDDHKIGARSFVTKQAPQFKGS